MFKKAIFIILAVMVVIKLEVVSLILLTLIGIVAVGKLFGAIVEHGNW